MADFAADGQIDYVEFASVDMGKTKKFYSTVFGWKFEDYGPAYTSFRDGRLSGGFRLSDPAPPGGPLVVIYASDLGPVEDEIRRAGGTITKAIFSFPGGSRFHFTDPNGNELAVWSDAVA